MAKINKPEGIRQALHISSNIFDYFLSTFFEEIQ